MLTHVWQDYFYIYCGPIYNKMVSIWDGSCGILVITLYCVIVAPYVRSVGHVFAYLYILDGDSERPMDYETSLPRKVFPLIRGDLFFMLIQLR